MIVPYVRVLSAPACDPVSLDTAKLWCKVDYDTDDALIQLIIKAAAARLEDMTGRAFVQRQLELRMDRFPRKSCYPNWMATRPSELTSIISLPFAPLQQVDYITYLDSNGVWQTLFGSPSQWQEDDGSTPGRITPLNGTEWPATQEGIGVVRIAYTCGYPPVGSPVDDDARRAGIPAEASLWMQARVATLYDKRDQLVIGGVVQIPRDFVDGLVDGLRVANNFA